MGWVWAVISLVVAPPAPATMASRKKLLPQRSIAAGDGAVELTACVAQVCGENCRRFGIPIGSCLLQRYTIGLIDCIAPNLIQARSLFACHFT